MCINKDWEKCHQKIPYVTALQSGNFEIILKTRSAILNFCNMTSFTTGGHKLRETIRPISACSCRPPRPHSVCCILILRRKSASSPPNLQLFAVIWHQRLLPQAQFCSYSQPFQLKKSFNSSTFIFSRNKLVNLFFVNYFTLPSCFDMIFSKISRLWVQTTAP